MPIGTRGLKPFIPELIFLGSFLIALSPDTDSEGCSGMILDGLIGAIVFSCSYFTSFSLGTDSSFFPSKGEALVVVFLAGLLKRES